MTRLKKLQYLLKVGFSLNFYSAKYFIGRGGKRTEVAQSIL